MEARNLAGILQTVIYALTTVSSLYLFCHFGNQVTHRYEDVEFAAYQLTWYRIPLDRRKDLIMMIAFAQRGVYIQGFASACCTREVFLRVCNFEIEIVLVCESKRRMPINL